MKIPYAGCLSAFLYRLYHPCEKSSTNRSTHHVQNQTCQPRTCWLVRVCRGFCSEIYWIKILVLGPVRAVQIETIETQYASRLHYMFFTQFCHFGGCKKLWQTQQQTKPRNQPLGLISHHPMTRAIPNIISPNWRMVYGIWVTTSVYTLRYSDMVCWKFHQQFDDFSERTKPIQRMFPSYSDDFPS